MLDAPVSGGEVGAVNATLSIMVGGDQAAFDRVKPILDVMGNPERVIRIGAVRRRADLQGLQSDGDRRHAGRGQRGVRAGAQGVGRRRRWSARRCSAGSPPARCSMFTASACCSPTISRDSARALFAKDLKIAGATLAEHETRGAGVERGAAAGHRARRRRSRRRRLLGARDGAVRAVGTRRDEGRPAGLTRPDAIRRRRAPGRAPAWRRPAPARQMPAGFEQCRRHDRRARIQQRLIGLVRELGGRPAADQNRELGQRGAEPLHQVASLRRRARRQVDEADRVVVLRRARARSGSRRAGGSARCRARSAARSATGRASPAPPCRPDRSRHTRARAAAASRGPRPLSSSSAGWRPGASDSTSASAISSRVASITACSSSGLEPVLETIALGVVESRDQQRIVDLLRRLRLDEPFDHLGRLAHVTREEPLVVAVLGRERRCVGEQRGDEVQARARTCRARPGRP